MLKVSINNLLSEIKKEKLSLLTSQEEFRLRVTKE